jgi:hypothetical protein
MNANNTPAAIFGLLFLVAMIVVSTFIISGIEWVSLRLLPWFSWATWISSALVAFVFLPLAIPRGTRRFSSTGLLISSYLFGITLWMTGFLYTLSLCGVFAVYVGLFLGGIAVVPIAMAATLFYGMWVPLISLLLLTIMTIATGAGALSLAKSLERSENSDVSEPRPQSILAVDNSEREPTNLYQLPKTPEFRQYPVGSVMLRK